MIQIEKYPSFLSPSSLNMAEKSPNKFYINRLSGINIIKEEQTLAAAIGSAFDYLIKEKIIKDKNLYKKEPSLNEMKKSVESNHSQAWEIGETIYKKYLSEVYDILLFEDVEITENFQLDLNFIGINYFIPLYIKMDATKKLNYFKQPTAHDWKVSGYTSESGISPKPGYIRIWDNGRLKSCHDKFTNSISIEDVDEQWGTQLCTYGWKLHGFGKDFPVSVDMLCFNDRNECRIAQYEAWVPIKFQQRVAYKYALLWSSILDGSFLNKLVSKRDINLIFIESLNESWW